MKQTVFKVLAKFNKMVLPSYKHKDLTKLKLTDKAIVGYRIWVTLNALEK